MRSIRSSSVFSMISLILLVLVACSPSIPGTLPLQTGAPSATHTASPPTSTPPITTAPPATATAQPPTLESNPYPLSEPGPYQVGMRSFTTEDASRNNRPVGITIWYPALPSEGSGKNGPIKDAAPDPSEAPYPLIISSTKFAETFAPYLVSHGFTWASVDKIDTYFHMYEQMFE